MFHHKASNTLLSKETGNRDPSATSESHHSSLQSCPSAHPRVHPQIQQWDVKHIWLKGLQLEAHPASAEPSLQPGAWSVQMAPAVICLNVELPPTKILIQWMTSLNLTKHFYKKPTFKSPVIFAWQSQWCAHTVLTKELLQLLTCPHPEVTQCPKGTSAAEQRYRRTFLKRQGNHPPLSSLCWAMGKLGNQLGGWSLWDVLLHNQQREREQTKAIIALPPVSCPDHPLQEPTLSLLATNTTGDLLPNLGTSENQAGEYSGNTIQHLSREFKSLSQQCSSVLREHHVWFWQQ